MVVVMSERLSILIIKYVFISAQWPCPNKLSLAMDDDRSDPLSIYLLISSGVLVEE